MKQLGNFLRVEQAIAHACRLSVAARRVAGPATHRPQEEGESGTPKAGPARSASPFIDEPLRFGARSRPVLRPQPGGIAQSPWRSMNSSTTRCSCGFASCGASSRTSGPLAEERGSELSEPVGAILEGAENALPLGDRQREHLRLGVVRVLQPLGDLLKVSLAEQSGELEHVLVADRDAGELHRTIICSLGRGALPGAESMLEALRLHRRKPRPLEDPDEFIDERALPGRKLLRRTLSLQPRVDDGIDSGGGCARGSCSSSGRLLTQGACADGQHHLGSRFPCLLIGGSRCMHWS